MSFRPKILVTESVGFSPQALELLREVGEVELGDLSAEDLWDSAGDFDVLWIRLRNYISSALIERASRLTVIATPTTGLNHIDLSAAAARGIQIVSLRGETAFLRDVRATAEHTLGLMLALLRHVPAATRSVCEGNWDRDSFKGTELYGKTVGVVGYGRVGKIVTRYLQAFDARVVATDARPLPEADGVKVLPLEELLAEADIVTVHVDLNSDSRDLFGWEKFERMKQGAYFINTSRGELVVEDDLLRALESQRLAGAALDVVRDEHRRLATDCGLVSYARNHGTLLLTPHIGGCTAESMEKTEMFLARKLAGVLSAVKSRSLMECGQAARV